MTQFQPLIFPVGCCHYSASSRDTWMQCSKQTLHVHVFINSVTSTSSFFWVVKKHVRVVKFLTFMFHFQPTVGQSPNVSKPSYQAMGVDTTFSLRTAVPIVGVNGGCHLNIPTCNLIYSENFNPKVSVKILMAEHDEYQSTNLW
jgi:hypothetical protein